MNDRELLGNLIYKDSHLIIQNVILEAVGKDMK